jgi:hypothetical protein
MEGIRENTTGRASTIGIWISCPDCGLHNKHQEFIPRDHHYELTEDVERTECLTQIVKVRTVLFLWQKRIQYFIQV